LRYWFSK